METGSTTSTKSAKRKRNRKSRAKGEAGSDVGASGGSVPTASPPLSAETDGGVSEMGAALVIDVVCGSNRAKLRVDGLRNGSKTPCVYVETEVEELGQGQGQVDGEDQVRSGAWMTPNQFQHASGRGTARDWKRSIKHHGTSLKSLISSHVLTVDPPHCRCAGCSGTATVSADSRPLNMVVNGDHSPLNLTRVVVATSNRRVNVTDEKPEVARRRKAELMAALRLRDCTAATGHRTPEEELSTDWNENQLLYEPPASKRRRTEDQEEEGEREEYEDSISVKTARSSLLRLLAVCSVTDVYNSYQRRQAHSRTAPEVPSSLAAVEADSVETGSGLTAEVEAADGEAEMDQKSLSQSWEGDVTECALTDPERSPAADNGMYPLAASLREAMSGEDRDATMSHIIHELRDYKKRLVEQIDASRLRATTQPPTGQTPSPPAAVCVVPTAQLAATNGHFPRPQPGALPDLVRSSIPEATKPDGGGRTRTIWNPALTVSYTVDACGALDLTTTHSRPAMVTSFDYPPSDTVLDLSCRRQPQSFSPPIMLTSLRQPKPEVHSDSALRSRGRQNRKSASSVSMATDHDNPMRWSVRDVIEFVSEVPGCQTYAETFKRFGVRGASLPVLSVDHMTGILRMREDAARALRAAIDRMMASYVTTATTVASTRPSHHHHHRRLATAESAVGVS